MLCSSLWLGRCDEYRGGHLNQTESMQVAASAVIDTGSPRLIHTFVMVVATALGIYLCYRLAVPFLSAITGALALAVLFSAMQRRLEKWFRHSGLAAAVSTLVIALIVVVPATFVGQQLAIQAVKGAKLVETKVKTGEWRHQLETQPFVASLIDQVESHIDLPEIAKSFTAWLSSTGSVIIKGSLVQLIGIFLTFYLLFFFLRDRDSLLQSLRVLSPLSAAQMNRLYTRVDDTIHATVYGTLAVSSMQGLLGGLMFWFLGLSAPLLWGVMMALLAVVPVLGAFVVWIPAAALLALEGNWYKALILAVWGIFVVGTIDNLMRPLLVGGRLKMHTVLAFLSIVGGLILFGPAGLILGPVGLAITMILLETWPNRGDVSVEHLPAADHMSTSSRPQSTTPTTPTMPTMPTTPLPL